MDYTKVPRILIYKNRTSLEDFGVYEPNSLNAAIYENLMTLNDLKPRYKGALNEILRLFNDAYYYLTQIFLEKNPLEQYATYCYDAGVIPKDYDFDMGSESREMVIKCMLFVMLRTFGNKLPDPQMRLLNAIVADINESNSCQDMGTTLRRLRGEEEDIAYKITCQFEFDTKPDSIRKQDYTRRDIQELLNSGISLKECLSAGKILREAVNTLCKNEKQKLTLIDRLLEAEKDGYGVDDKLVIESYHSLHELRSELTGEPLPEKLPFKRFVDVSPIPMQSRNLQNNNDSSNAQNMIDHDNRIEELEAQVEELEKRLKEAHTLPETVTAQQKVRMELARKLMERAGINNVVLEKWGTKDKAGTLMGTLLDIRPSTCKTYLSDPCLNLQYHEKTVKDINNILEILEVDFRL